MKKTKQMVWEKNRNPVKIIRTGILSLSLAAIAVGWTLQAGNQNLTAASPSWDDRDQFSESVGPNVYNAAAYSKMEDEITESIKNDPLLIESQAVEVSVQDGVVTIRGEVKTEKEHDLIVGHAREAAGLAQVQDQLKVRSI